MEAKSSQPRLALVYIVAFVTGAIVMSFEMLGSRYLNPYFGSGIYTWASLISTVLIALAAGYVFGGWLADRSPTMATLGGTVIIGSAYLVILPAFSDPILEAVLASIDNVKFGSLISALAIMFFPVVFLGMYSPFAIRLLLRSTQQSGSVSGAVYGISTFGSIVGTLGTTFFLMPLAGSRSLTIALGAIGVISGITLIITPLLKARLTARSNAAAVLIAAAIASVAPSPSKAADVLDDRAVAAVLAMKDGTIARLETDYNNIFITKRQSYVVMAFQRYSEKYTESVSNLKDPKELPVYYTQVMTLGAIYPDEVKNCLMIGLGGGSLSTYLAAHMPDLTIDNVELDPGVIAAAKRYFGLRETQNIRFFDSDGRVYLNRNKTAYDLILIDAFRGGYVPFHLLTKEFYVLLKQRLSASGVVVFNIHSGTKLYSSTLLTLKSVFPAVDLYSANGNVIAIAGGSEAQSNEALKRRAGAVQQRIPFRYPLPTLLGSRMEWPEIASAELLTDDFAPVDLYDAIREGNKRKW